VLDRESLLRWLQNGGYLDALSVLALLGYAIAVSDFFFFFDDFYFLDGAIRDPLGRLVTPREHFLFRPLSQYGFFGVGHLFFGIHAGGYYFFHLAILAGVAASARPIARFFGFDGLEARAACALMLLSPPVLKCLSWLSYVQQSLDVLLVLAMLGFEIRWLEKRRAIHKVLAILCFGLGVTTNVVVVIAFPLLVLIYARHASMRRPLSPPDWRQLTLGYGSTVVPSSLIFFAFYAVYQRAPAYAGFQAGMADPSSPYYLRFTVEQIVANLGHFLGYLFPFGVAMAPLLIALLLAWGAWCLATRSLRETDGRGVQKVGFALAWSLISVSPFLLLANRTNPTMALLAAAGAYPLVATLLLSPVRELARRWRMAWVAPVVALAMLAVPMQQAVEFFDKRQLGGYLQRSGIERINELADGHFPDATTLYLVNEAPRRPGETHSGSDWVRTSYGFGSINPAFVGGREIEFVSRDEATQISRREDDAAMISYRPNFHFFVRPGARR